MSESCPSCHKNTIATDYERYERFCTDCGIVVPGEIISNEVIGIPGVPLKQQDRGGLGSEGAPSHLKQLNRQARVRGTKPIGDALRMLEELASTVWIRDRLNEIPEVRQAKWVYQKAQQQKLTRDKYMPAMAAAVLYAGCKIVKPQTKFEDVPFIRPILRKITLKFYKMLVWRLELNVKTPLEVDGPKSIVEYGTKTKEIKHPPKKEKGSGRIVLLTKKQFEYLKSNKPLNQGIIGAIKTDLNKRFPLLKEELFLLTGSKHLESWRIAKREEVMQAKELVQQFKMPVFKPTYEHKVKFHGRGENRIFWLEPKRAKISTEKMFTTDYALSSIRDPELKRKLDDLLKKNKIPMGELNGLTLPAMESVELDRLDPSYNRRIIESLPGFWEGKVKTLEIQLESARQHIHQKSA